MIKHLNEKIHNLIRIKFGTVQAVRIYLYFKNLTDSTTEAAEVELDNMREFIR